MLMITSLLTHGHGKHKRKKKKESEDRRRRAESAKLSGKEIEDETTTMNVERNIEEMITVDQVDVGQETTMIEVGDRK